MVKEGLFTIYPIAEAAVTIEYGTEISMASTQTLLRTQELIQQAPFSGYLDSSLTYHSLTIFFNPGQLFSEGQHSPLAFVMQELQTLLRERSLFPLNEELPFPKAQHHLVPVCYEAPVAPDLLRVAEFHQSSPENIIQAHCSQDWFVFMIGFNPGFAYLGLLPENLAMPRKACPARKVLAGSVGIAGKQTGIYPNDSPGGWQIIGRTPLKVFDPTIAQPCLLHPGDTVRFTPIDYTTFQYLNQHANL